MLEVLLNVDGFRARTPYRAVYVPDSSSQTDGTNSTADSSSEATQEDRRPQPESCVELHVRVVREVHGARTARSSTTYSPATTGTEARSPLRPVRSQP